MSLTSDREKDEKTRAMLSERAEWRSGGEIARACAETR